MDTFLTRPLCGSPKERNDKAAIVELINFERYCRDNALWDEMRKCFSPDSIVNISWYCGSGDGFVTESSKLNRHSEHLLHNTLTWINENRAVTIMISTIIMRQTIDDVECELSADVQLHFCTKKIDGQWFIYRFESIYEQDRLIPVLPNAALDMGSSKLSAYRKSYACMSYASEQTGRSINQGLIGTDRPDMVKDFRAKLAQWLDGKWGWC